MSIQTKLDIANAIVRKGNLRKDPHPDDPDDYGCRLWYGWIDEDYPHKRECAVSPVPETLREFDEHEFTDTEHDPRRIVGMEVQVNCVCGRWQNRWMRWEATSRAILAYVLAWGEE